MKMPNPYTIAQQVTDEVMGEGTYAKLNVDNPNPGVQGAIAITQEIYPEFMQGYTRDDEVASRLSVALIKLLVCCPKQRLGQIILNAIPVETDLFLLHDEELAPYLEEYLQEFGEL